MVFERPLCVALDGFTPRSRVSTTDVANVLEKTRDKMFAYLRRHKMLAVDADDEDEMTPLEASAVAGTSPPAGPEWRRGTLPVTHQAMKTERPLCVALDGFTLHAATRTGAMDDAGRESLLKYILRPSVAQERVTRGTDGLVPIAVKKPFADGTVAVDMDPLSLLSRLAASVPPPKFHTVPYSGVLASASKLRSRIAPKPPVSLPTTHSQDDKPTS